ncbi:hypothetical protein Ahy_B01g053639 [Arachis hypogaea]|uniref:MULE transposase domain-containing protein n=1 Tax=Arachis hypogaea TaxID=3818 RepID=A0A445AS64_ARAHY|nr:hypothetical protein Ahy_B01g053639 [Arachis hypogaea]
MLKQHRKLSMFVRCTIETHEEAGIRPSKTYQSFVAAAGSHRDLSFIEKDVRNYITRKVQNISEKYDAKEFGKYLVRMKEKNQNFFFELNLEGDHCIKHAFWADARSKAAFDYFGDVVSFDTTYNTNRYNLVLGSFVGVNHHGQSTLLGCALMKNEDIQSFKWLFEAIELCVPSTIHRWCIWHIMKKIPRKLNGYKEHIDIEQEMSHVVWNSYTKDDFDRNWNDFLTKYGLEGNKWLSELYEDRHIWILVYLDHHFWAGMRSTQRSESVHSFFNKFITKNSSLRQFVKQYDNCLASREQAKREFDAADFHTVIPGILCRHSLCVLSFERVDNVALKYILERWSKNIKRRHTHIKSSQDEPVLEPRSKTFDELVFRSHNISEFASESEELTGILHRADKVMAEMEEYQERRKGKILLTHEEATLSNVNDLQSPPRIKTRGRPKNRLA